MPTGYTYAIEQGCTFEEYVWGCARNFGALIMMRDEPADAPVPERFEPSTYNQARLAEAEQKLNELNSMTAEQITAAMEAERQEALETNARYLRESEEKNLRYETIRQRVTAWEPPSPDHQGLKKFMLEQIDLCYPDKPYQCELPTSDRHAWLAEKKQRVERDIEYHTAEHAKEMERTNGRNQWLRQVRDSVPQPMKGAA